MSGRDRNEDTRTEVNIFFTNSRKDERKLKLKVNVYIVEDQRLVTLIVDYNAD